MSAEAKNAALWRVIFGGILLSGILAIVDITKIAAEKGFSLTQPKWLFLIAGIGILAFLGGLLFTLTWTKYFSKLEASSDAFLRLGEKIKWFLLPLLVVSLSGVTLFELEPYFSGLFGNYFWTKIFSFFIFLFVGAFFLRAFFPSLSWSESFVWMVLGQLLIYYFPTKFTYFTNYPFALGWTSDSRHYYASLFFSEKLYDQNLPLPILHPSLHLLLSIPFLFGRFPLIVHRLWGTFLPWVLAIGISWALLRQTLTGDKKPRSFSILIGIWIFLYLVRASIYAHLLLPTLLIFLFVSPEKKWRSWATIILASLWAGMSRINWFPVPAMLAALIFLLEVPQNRRKLFDYLKLPALWFIFGTASAFLSQAVYIQISGNGGREEFYTSLASDLLWYRLLPNQTYAPGIILGALFLSLPLLLFVALHIYRHRGSWQPIRLWGVFGAVFILFVGGLVVSTKIGGGADLHNMDAYFVSILLVAGIVYTRGFAPDSVSKYLPAKLSFPVVVIALGSLVGMILTGRGGLPRTNWDWANASLNDLKFQITHVAEQGEDVLFIAQRNFVTFGMVDIPLIAEYEKDVLMEMAMARNDAYLDGFHDALRQHDFGMIVIDPQSGIMLSEERSFAIENNRWVLKVTRPLLCYYEPLVLYEDVGVELFVPRAESIDCE
ncbi:MAG: hypothetical protein HN855_12360 [Anaerolineae bacterium]|jgi:hypothetical protein|nr:hypothetical protein [Anaerolineae bacterium]MBT7069338.1 hypothetical protein [Anaerolineae bacterium]MBT7325946.1 hypothetical protein [Anaerolineae bacterium]